MASSLHTPGVYIEEKNAFYSGTVAVPTAVPVFIGYTEKTPALNKPTRITSFAEFTHYFGGAYKPLFTLQPGNADESILINNQPWQVDFAAARKFILFESMRMFYDNGGAECYVLSLHTYTNDQGETHEPAIADYAHVFSTLETEQEPSLVVMPDAILLSKEQAYNLYQQALQHCATVKSRFAIFDVAIDGDDPIKDFRAGIENNNLSYGAAYYPWLHTSPKHSQEINYTFLDGGLEHLISILPATETVAVQQTDTTNTATVHQLLKKNSPTYVKIIQAITSKLNLLPPAAAMAGIYSMVDNSRGVWKAPANVNVSNVTGLTVNISHEQQQELNVDIREGKSINVIRPFPGIGTLVWGARTLDGNHQDWRYINVRRTLIMIEQSIKLAIRAFVFEPNDAGTWITIQSMIQNFLFNLWREGALAGASPEEAYSVQVGLGNTMTPNDILDGILKLQVKLAITRPAEFIIITLQQQQQQS